MVDPRGVVTAHGMTYLDAWCHSAEAPRLFRIDRIAAAEVTDQPIETPVEAPRDLSEGIFAQSDDTALVTLRLAPPAAGWSSTTRWRRSARSDDGTLEVDLLVADERWLLRLLLRLAPHASVLSPPEYAEEFTRLTRETLGPVLSCGVRWMHDRPRLDEDPMTNPLIGMPQGAEWLVILAIVILVFGAAKLPDLARGTGQALRIFKSETKGLKDDEARTRRSRAATTSRRPLPSCRGSSAEREPRRHGPPARHAQRLTAAAPSLARVDLRGRPALRRPTRPPGRPRRPDGAVGPPARAARPDPQDRADPRARAGGRAVLLRPALRPGLRPLPPGPGEPPRGQHPADDQRRAAPA